MPPFHARPAEPTSASGSVHEVLHSPGRPLLPAVRGFMESRLGHDFGQVRVHTDAKAAESAQAVNALAYTVGSHIVFAAGEYAPESTRGRRLLAHELMHVLQQGQQPVAEGTALRIGPADSPCEQEADRQAAALASDAQPPTAAGHASPQRPAMAGMI